MRKKILVVDDEQNMLKTLHVFFKKEGYDVVTASDAKNALAGVQKESFDLILTDLKMPGLSGLELIRKLKTANDSPAVMIMTAFASIESAVECIKEGALDYFVKPFDLDEVKIKIERFFNQKELLENIQSLESETFSLQETVKHSYDYDRIIGSNAVILKIHELIKELAAVNTSVLITGETGTGKELVARAIHYRGIRKDKPFLKVVCSSFAGGVLESELFGHEKGSFTGAIATKKGRFELADGGTLFLDEIGDLSQEVQIKLLHTLEDKSFERVGGEKTLQVDVRILSATNKDLKHLVREGVFREDLYFRLNVINIHLPPLRERMEDIPRLVSFFIEKYNRELGRKLSGIDDDALRFMMQYDWPGNIRELRNIVERMMVLEKTNILTAKNLPEEIRQENIFSEDSMLSPTDRSEKKVIQSVLLTTRSMEEAAKKLDVDRTTLWRKIKKYNIDVASLKRN